MEKASDKYLAYLAAKQDMMRERIRNTPTSVRIKGKSYYVAESGCDENDGLSPDRPWQSLKKATEAELAPGDGVFFKRGDIFRGQLVCQPGVTYSAYGEGKKPEFYGWYENYGGAENWECVNEEKHFWRLKKQIPDTGTLVFNEGEAWAIKMIPSFIGDRFVLRDDPAKDFVFEEQATEDLMFFQNNISEIASGVPVISPSLTNIGELTIRCDKGNPGEAYSSIEILPRRNTIVVKSCPDVTVDNICVKYCGAHGVGTGTTDGLTVQNCEFGWIGGSIQHYNASNPARKGIVTRYGNGVEIYGGCHNYTVKNCYFYQIYDAAITHQVNATGRYLEMHDVEYVGNLIETSSYSIEYFLSMTDLKFNKSNMKNFRIADNFMVDSGCGWGDQRYNKDTPSHIKSWNSPNPCENYVIENNVFFNCRYDLLQVGCINREGAPVMRHNTYVQKLGGSLGNVGTNPNALHTPFSGAAENIIRLGYGDKDAEIYYID